LPDSRAHKVQLLHTPKDPARDGFLRLIAVFKLCKATLLIATAWGILKFLNADFAARVETWVHTLPWTFEQHLIRRAIEWLTGHGAARVHLLSAASMTYAGLFLVEGYGLWRGRHWAEWLTTIATASLIPVEVYEITVHQRPEAVVVFIGNVAILAYLVRRLRLEARARRASRSTAAG
jgi:uncharacterized membrane protein (DUF2068 family)